MTHLFHTIITSFLLSGFAFLDQAVLAAPLLDVDRDGLDDYVSVSAVEGGSLAWIVRGSANGAIAPLGPFGTFGDHLAPGVWRQGGASDRVVLSRATDSAIVWNLEGVASFPFGVGAGTTIAGMDFDNSGILDAAFVEKRGGDLVWQIRIDPFASEPAGGSVLEEIVFGADQDLPFFLNPDGAGDWLAVFRPSASIIRLRHPQSAEEREIPVPPALLSSGIPHPIKRSDGRDALVFTQRSGASTVARVLDLDGQLIATTRIPAAETVVVGDFDARFPGEEVTVQGGRSLKGYNPFSKRRFTVRFAADILVDAVNINEFSGPASDPGFQSCSAANPRDGAKHAFTWKPNSDTTYYAVAVLPGKLFGQVSKVEVFTASGVIIKQLRMTGCGNPDSDGPRCNHKDFQLTGGNYKSRYGSIFLKVSLNDNSCLSYFLDDPAKRID